LGYSKKLEKNILKVEQSIRNNKNESAYAFNPKTGHQVFFAQGKGSNVRDLYGLPSNSVLTHNHPRSIGKKGWQAIGNSFSLEDIKTAIAYNVAEIRAVTPTYTFSLKRPQSGWGISPESLELRWKQIKNQLRRTANTDYINIVKGKDRDIRIERCQITHYHNIMTVISREYGWTYSKKNS
jgi:hypothetical protein